ncbi:MAG: DUF72 domain-containing protein [Candidatus Helarchaeota archaeon]|nr:DUF72 domain-containing protein [Candidatus Helarchaeota archaeon]
MNQLYIGCGGWAYADFGDSPGTQLENYAKLFNFVEINSTFYSIPKITLCERWRKSVPADFSFAIKCNRGVSHLGLLKSSNQVIKLFKKMIEICKTLKAMALVIQTPQSFLNKPQNLKNANDFFASIESPIDLVWEVRGYQRSPQLKSELLQTFSEYNISHCTDISKDVPLYTANLVYSRIFGHGKQNMWQFSDEEIKSIHNTVENLRKEKKVVLSFHTMRMERDSARYQEFSNKNVLIPATNSIGLQSFMDVIKEYNKFPISKKELLEAHGWKIVDMTSNLRIRASELLKKLPNQKFSNFGLIEKSLQNIIGNKNQKKLEQFI